MKISNLNLWAKLNPKSVSPPKYIGQNNSGSIFLVATTDDDTKLVVVSDGIEPANGFEAWELTDLFNSQTPPELIEGITV